MNAAKAWDGDVDVEYGPELPCSERTKLLWYLSLSAAPLA